MRNDISEIVGLLHKRRLTEHVVLYTNGFNTQNILSAVEKMLINAPRINFFIGVSIDGFEEAHDQYRNMLGSYTNAQNTLVLLKNLKGSFANLHVGVSITLHKGNQNIALGLIEDIHQRLGLIPGLTLIRGEPRSPQLKAAGIGIYEECIRLINRLKKNSAYSGLLYGLIDARESLGQRLAFKTYAIGKRSYACYAGSLLAVLYANGDVFPCEMLGDGASFGNLRDFDYDFKKIWDSDRAKAVRGQIKKRQCFCTYECQYTCNVLYNIRFAPYLAYACIKGCLEKKLNRKRRDDKPVVLEN